MLTEIKFTNNALARHSSLQLPSVCLTKARRTILWIDIDIEYKNDYQPSLVTITCYVIYHTSKG